MIKITMLFSCLILILPQQEKMVKTKIGDYITVSLPQSFYAMPPQDIAQRYPSVRSPLGAYTNHDRLVDFSVNISATRWQSTDIEIAKAFFKSSIVNLYDRVDFIREDISLVGDMRYIVFEFDSRINGDKYSLDQQDAIRKYTYLMYLLINGKTVVFTFNAPAQIKDKWVPVAQEVMQSIKVKHNFE